ncbi:MAG: response regulator [Melioribacteraceae bacterium]|nr:response regulator [Melioribacteraceae bacterium]MCF8353134.1 response regulator [Melioribacteraceae bacterium]MCF8396158.1 response regulator [Melioribacteraceae bacterium]MCF8418251.1 response regulator [Melioribacteraceae bacterium]
MRVQLISNDPNLVELFNNQDVINKEYVIIKDKDPDALEILSTICTENPNLVILDDDFIKPKSCHLIRSIKKIRSNTLIVFLTGNSSLDLGREISQLGIEYYGIKPLQKEQVIDLLRSINNRINKNNQYII